MRREEGLVRPHGPARVAHLVQNLGRELESGNTPGPRGCGGPQGPNGGERLREGVAFVEAVGALEASGEGEVEEEGGEEREVKGASNSSVGARDRSPIAPLHCCSSPPVPGPTPRR